MDYQIISANAEAGQIEVLYKHAGRDLAVYAIDVPIVEGSYLTGDALVNEILHRAPTWLVERETAKKTAAGFSAIEALVVPLPVPPVTHDEMWADVMFEKQVAKALLKFGILQSDPTAIEVTQL